MTTDYADFKGKIDAFLAKYQMAESTFGREAIGDSKFYYSIKNHKRSPTLKTVQRVEKFMETFRTPEAK